ncbi:MAG TPA: Fic family protein [Bryobacteraceae bacterium]|nr:Fic family protein [Bryobacteraceae bacterium]
MYIGRMEYGYRWKPLIDLTSDQAESRNTELATLSSVWREQKASLEDKGIVQEFTAKLLREMAIEGGIIERAYTLDRGITIQLIEHGIHASLIPHHSTNKDPNWVAAIIQNHLTAAEGLFEWIHQGRDLTVGFVKQLHSVLMSHQDTTQAMDPYGNFVEVPLRKGEYKIQPNNPMRADGKVHQYCPPEHVASEMDHLIQLHRSHVTRLIAPEVQAAWLHHAFTQIHPFQDGNGRVARLLASYVFIRHHYFPLVVTDRERTTYIRALEEADQSGDLGPLIGLMSAVQRSTFVKVLSLAGETQRGAELDQVIESAVRTATTRVQAQQLKLEAAKKVGRRLMERAEERLTGLAAKLREKFSSVPSRFQFTACHEWNEGGKRHYFRAQVIEAARSFEYFANPSVYHDWVRLAFRTEEQAEILVSLHALGHEYRGLLAASAIFFRRSQSGEGTTEVTAATPLTDTWFQISYLDSDDALKDKFDLWLNKALTKGVALWQKGL